MKSEADVAAPTTELLDKSLFKGGVLSAFGYRDFRLLWSGVFLSNVGTPHTHHGRYSGT